MKAFKATKLLIFLTLLFTSVFFVYQYVYLPKLGFRNVGDCVPINFRKVEKDGQYFFDWETKGECVGYIRYGVKDTDLPYLALDIQGVVKLKQHRVKLTGISKNDQYYFVTISNNSLYGDQGAPTLITF